MMQLLGNWKMSFCRVGLAEQTWWPIKCVAMVGLIASTIAFSGCSDRSISEAQIDNGSVHGAVAQVSQAQIDSAPGVTAQSSAAEAHTVALKTPFQETVTPQGTDSGGQVQAEDLIQEPAEEGMLQRAGDLFDRAKSTTGETAKGAKDWVQDKIGGAADASSAAAEDTLKWATDTFESLKSQGLTTASDTSQWLSQDWKNMESWEYNIVAFSQKTDEEKSQQLNELGKNGWECYHVSGTDAAQKFYLKKRKESFLRHLPFKDFIKLVPLMQQANQ